jgi:hypothetical protein
VKVPTAITEGWVPLPEALATQFPVQEGELVYLEVLDESTLIVTRCSTATAPSAPQRPRTAKR